MGYPMVDSSWSTARTAMRMTATLPPLPAGDKALEEVRSGQGDGAVDPLPSGPRAHGERHSGLSRRPILRGIAITRAPSYTDSRVEARARKRKIWL